MSVGVESGELIKRELGSLVLDCVVVDQGDQCQR